MEINGILLPSYILYESVWSLWASFRSRSTEIEKKIVDAKGEVA